MVFIHQGCLQLTGDTPQEWVPGYLLSKPLPKADLTHLMATGNPIPKARAATP